MRIFDEKIQKNIVVSLPSLTLVTQKEYLSHFIIYIPVSYLFQVVLMRWSLLPNDEYWLTYNEIIYDDLVSRVVYYRWQIDPKTVGYRETKRKKIVQDETSLF